ncbi:MAG: 2-phosphosulfolactate phosphatase [Actinobacteria bacterium]|nr:2-phosphosulfolactate phosphatase [Actinomycetota bacterium]
MSRVRVAFLPEALRPDAGGVCAVIDVIRATTTLVALAEAGDPEVWLAPDPERARSAAVHLRGPVLLCGEQGGLKPPGFDYGNSPRELATLRLGGQTVVFATTNGTKALRSWSGVQRTYVAALRNVGAVAWRLLESASVDERSITLVCAGRNGEVALEDVYTAGAVVRRMLHTAPKLALDETAVIAMHVNRGYASPREALEASASAKLLERVGLFEDVAFCAAVDASIAVPELGPHGRLRVLEDGRGANSV